MLSWLRTLRGQFVVVVALAVILSSVAVIAILEVAREGEIRRVRTDALLDRVATSFQFVGDLSPAQRDAAVRAVNTNFYHYWLLPYAPLANHSMTPEESRMAAAVAAEQESAVLGPIVVRLPPDTKIGPDDGPSPQVVQNTTGRARDRNRRNGPRLTFRADDAIEIAQAIGPDGWLLARVNPPNVPPRAPDMLIAAALAATLTSVAAAWIGGRVSRPLSALAAAADHVARGRNAPHLEERGPDDLRQAAEAFNSMSDRVTRTLESHRQLLSAVGHDLRTPLAAMRITAEFVEDKETRGRLTRNLDELQALTESVLAAVRTNGNKEMHRVDLVALLHSVCDDLVDLGQPVELDATGTAPCLCRSSDIRRAVRNLIENAVRYGGSAHVYLHKEPDRYETVVTDDGPGIPEDRLEDVFEPFIRLEESRSTVTGGSGLGLTLARTIAREHGGDVILKNRAGGGLEAILRLPREQRTAA